MTEHCGVNAVASAGRDLDPDDRHRVRGRTTPCDPFARSNTGSVVAVLTTRPDPTGREQRLPRTRDNTASAPSVAQRLGRSTSSVYWTVSVTGGGTTSRALQIPTACASVGDQNNSGRARWP